MAKAPGGPEAQEEYVSGVMKPAKGSKLKIHNIKTATQLLQSF